MGARKGGAKKAAKRRTAARKPAARKAAARKAPARKAAARKPAQKSVISRVVEQVRSTAGSIGSSISSKMPHRDVEEGGPTNETQRRADYDDSNR